MRHKVLQLPVCTLSSGHFIGHESLIGLSEPLNTEFKCRGSCKTHVLLASAVADLVHLHPHAIQTLRDGVEEAHIKQQEFFQSELEMLEDTIEAFQRTLMEGEAKAAKTIGGRGEEEEEESV